MKRKINDILITAITNAMREWLAHYEVKTVGDFDRLLYYYFSDDVIERITYSKCLEIFNSVKRRKKNAEEQINGLK